VSIRWQTKQLGQLCQLISGQHIDARNYNGKARGIGYLTGPSDFGPLNPVITKWTEHPKITAKRGDILLTVKGSGVGKINLLAHDEVAISRQLMALRITDADPRFIYAYLGTTLNHFQNKSTGAAIPGISREQVLELVVPLPPLPEQQRIVRILDEAFDSISSAKTNTEKNRQNARALFEIRLQAAFAQENKNRERRPLGELCERITKGSSPKWQGIAYLEQPGILFVTSENVGEYRLLMDKPKYVEEKFNAKDKKSILKKGDVLTNIVGASIGRTAVFDLDDIANINQAVCLIRCNPSLLNNYYLTYLLNSPVFKQVLHDNEVDNARANLSLAFFSQLSVPLPALAEQIDIVAELDHFRKETLSLASIYHQKLAALDALKKSLLHQAFSGAL
jgi:type I restriction enzyme S subunit